MSGEVCPNCGETMDAGSTRCGACGLPVGGSNLARAGLHPAAPIVFAAAGLAVGAAVTLATSLALGIPAGLFGGGLGVWMLERGRRLL
jgi:hypothetical protein